MKTRHERIKQQISKLESTLYEMERERERREAELETYVRRHKSLKFDDLRTADVNKLLAIYAYFDSRYKIQWQGGLRCDNRGMALHYWIDNDPDYLILHLSSTSENICFSGSTSWIVKAPTLEDKVGILQQTKKDIQKIIKEKKQ